MGEPNSGLAEMLKFIIPHLIRTLNLQLLFGDIKNYFENLYRAGAGEGVDHPGSLKGQGVRLP